MGPRLVFDNVSDAEGGEREGGCGTPSSVLRKAPGGSGRLREAPEGSGELRMAPESSGRKRGNPETRLGSNIFGTKNDFRMPRGNPETQLGSSIFGTKNDIRKPPNTVWFRDFGSLANP